MHVPHVDLALEDFLQWLECTMLACGLVSIKFFETMLTDAEHVDVRVDHKCERTALGPSGCILRGNYCT